MSKISNELNTAAIKPSDSALFTAAGDSAEESQLMEVAAVLPQDPSSRDRLAQIIQSKTASSQGLGGAWKNMGAYLTSDDRDDCGVSDPKLTDPNSPSADPGFKKLIATMLFANGQLSEANLRNIAGINGRDLGIA